MDVSKEQLEKIARCIEELNQHASKCMVLIADMTLKGREIEKILYKMD